MRSLLIFLSVSTGVFTHANLTVVSGAEAVTRVLLRVFVAENLVAGGGTLARSNNRVGKEEIPEALKGRRVVKSLGRILVERSLGLLECVIPSMQSVGVVTTNSLHGTNLKDGIMVTLSRRAWNRLSETFA